MTVALIVVEPSPPELANFIIPVATEDTYKEIWIPGAAQTKAFWLPMFQTGAEVTDGDFAEVSQELVLLREWVEIQSIDLLRKKHVLKRIDQLKEGLEQLRTRTDGAVTVFIG